MRQPRGSYRGNAPQSSIARTEKPSIVPSAFTGTVTSRNVRSLPCVFAVCWSVRHSVHCTGRLSLRARRQQAVYWGCSVILLPKPPPMSWLTNRSLSMPTRIAELGGVACELARARDHSGDRIADVAHTADRERIVLDVRPRRRRELEEGIGEDRHLVARERPVHPVQLVRLRDVDGLDACVRVRR